jgi:hypothetical protein
MADRANGHAVVPERPDAIRADAGYVALAALGERHRWKPLSALGGPAPPRRPRNQTLH